MKANKKSTTGGKTIGILITILVCSLSLNFLQFFQSTHKKPSKSASKDDTSSKVYPKFLKLNEENSCENGELAQDKLPLCPKANKPIILPNYYPVHSIYVGYQPGNPSTGFFESLLQAADDAVPLMVLVPRNQAELAERELEPLLRVERDSRIRLFHTPSRYTMWAQDYFEFAYSPGSVKPMIIDLPYKSEIGEHIPPAISLACNFSRIAQAPIDADSLSRPAGNYGGNIEALTEKIVLVGDSIHQEQLAILEKELDQKIVFIETKWLSVGHVDELFSVIPKKNSKSSCPFDVLYASPAKALGLVKIAGKDANAKPVPMHFGEGESKEVFNLLECGRDSRAAKGCDYLVRASQTYEQSIQNSIKRIKRALRREHNCSSVKFVPIPILFGTLKELAEYGTDSDGAFSLDPNPVNNFILNNVIFLPKQNLSIFHKYTQEVLNEYEFKLEFVDGKFVHAFRGGLHCATNIRRACREE